MKIIDVKPDETPFDEARRQIDEWERSEKAVRHIVLICDGDDVVTTVAGVELRPSEAAGLCFAAAHSIMEEA